MDSDGYPDEDELKRIAEWSYEDLLGWIDYIETLWAYADWGWREDKDQKKLYLSTAGWSGNESLIAAMQQNKMAWHLLWEQSRRGGHYIFDLERANV